jgi:hypothetical protein
MLICERFFSSHQLARISQDGRGEFDRILASREPRFAYHELPSGDFGDAGKGEHRPSRVRQLDFAEPILRRWLPNPNSP